MAVVPVADDDAAVRAAPEAAEGPAVRVRETVDRVAALLGPPGAGPRGVPR